MAPEDEKVELTEERKGEIALKLLHYHLCKVGVRVGPGMTRRIKQIAKETKLPAEELKAFAKWLVMTATEEAFSKPMEDTDDLRSDRRRQGGRDRSRNRHSEDSTYREPPPWTK